MLYSTDSVIIYIITEDFFVDISDDVERRFYKDGLTHLTMIKMMKDPLP